MNNNINRPTVSLGLCALVFSACLAGAAYAQDKPLTAEDAALISITAKVEAIDMATRQVTLRGPLGNVASFTVDKRVTRLNEVKVGDEVTADYYVAYAAEVRTPTDEEKAHPLTVLQEKAKAPAGTDPAAGGLRVIKVVATVEGLDRPTRSLTVSGPQGNMVSFRVKDVANLPKLRIGDTIVVTYAEALAVSLQKKAPR